MPTEDRHDLTALLAALTGLAPAPPRVDRDGLFYSAGRAAGSRWWRRAACGFAGLTVALTAILCVRPVRVEERPVVVTVPVEVRVPSEPPSAPSPPADAPVVRSDPFDGPTGSPSLDARSRVLRWGPDALPNLIGSPTAVAAPPVRPLEQDLDLPPGSLNGVDTRRSLLSPAPW